MQSLFLFNVHFVDAAKCENQHNCAEQAHARQPKEQTLVGLRRRVYFQKRDERVFCRTDFNCDAAEVESRLLHATVVVPELTIVHILSARVATGEHSDFADDFGVLSSDVVRVN